MRIKKAIIPAAGFGTRFLPITKTIQKEMLPILNRPIIDYLVDDCVKAGIEEIVFVVKESDRQIQHYYSEDLVLKRYLDRMGKSDKYSQVEQLHKKAKFKFVFQKESDPYGTGVPVLLAKKEVESEDAFLVLMGDDFFLNSNSENEISKMIKTFTDSKSQGLVNCVKVPFDQVKKYGIALYEEVGPYKFLKDQIEKPEPDEINSNLVTISKYIFTPKIFDYLDLKNVDSKSKEVYLTTAYSALAKEHKMVIHEPKGEYIDSGYLTSWLKGNLIIARQNESLWSELKPILRELLD